MVEQVAERHRGWHVGHPQAGVAVELLATYSGPPPNEPPLLFSMLDRSSFHTRIADKNRRVVVDRADVATS